MLSKRERMKFTVQQIAALIEGEVVGDASLELNTLCKIEEGVPQGLSFLANPKYTSYIYETKAGAVVVSRDFVPEMPVSATMIKVADPYSCFARLLQLADQLKEQRSGVDSLSFVDKTVDIPSDAYVGAFAVIEKGAQIGRGVQIYPHVYIGEDVVIGDKTILYSGVKIYQECKVGRNCIIHAGAVIGSDGFGFAPQEDLTLKKIPQIGNVVVEDDVEIGANTTIDRSTMGSTIIRRGAKIDNLCQIAHNSVVGEDTGMAAQVGLAGSVKIGQRCRVGGQAGFAGHLTVGDDSTIGAQSGIISDVSTGSTVIGAPAFNAKDFMRSSVFFRKLPVIVRRVERLQSRIDELEKKLGDK